MKQDPKKIKKRVEMYQQAYKNRYFLRGDESVDKLTKLSADWEHYNFMFAVHGKEWAGRPTTRECIQAFWAILWQYIGPLLDSYEQLKEGFDIFQEEMDDVLKSHAELKMDWDLFKHFIETKADPQTKYEWNKYHTVESAKIDAKIEELKKEEAERDERRKKKMEEKIKERQEKKEAQEAKVIPFRGRDCANDCKVDPQRSV